MADANSGFLQSLSDTLDWVVRKITILLFGLMTVVVLIGVLFRYGFRVPLSWTEELSRYLMIWGASLAVSSGIKFDEHVGLTVLLDSIQNRPLRMVLHTIITLLVLGFLLIMTWYAFAMTVESRYQIAQSLGVSMFLPSLAIPVAMGLAVIQLILTYLLRLKRGDRGDEHEARVIDI